MERRYLILGAPVEYSDAANKKYVDSLAVSSSFLKRDGTLAMTGDLKLGGHKISNVAAPVNSADAANKLYVDIETTKIFNE